MLLLTATTDKLQLVTDVAADIDVHASYVDADSSGLGSLAAGRQNTAITTATTTDIVAAPGASKTRNVKTLNVRNKDPTDATNVTVVFDQNGADFELFKTTLKAGDVLEYVEGVGWFTYQAARLDRWLIVPSDAVNATTSWADVTGLTCSVENGKTYNFETHLIHAENATTTGPRFGINGPSLSNIIVSILDVVTLGTDTTTMRSGAATAVDTSAAGASATGKTGNATAIMSGSFTAGANGTFAVRFQSEVAVASALTVKAGSWCHLWEPTG